MGTVAIRTVGVGMAPDELSRLANEVGTGALFISAQDSRGRTILGAVYVTPDGDLFDGDISDGRSWRKVVCPARRAFAASKSWTAGVAVEVGSDAEAAFLEASSLMEALAAVSMK